MKLSISHLILSVLTPIILLALSLPVYAKDFNALTNWSVSRILEPQKGEPYCTLARVYQDNIVITHSINENDETSIAFDFQNLDLDTERSYSVKIAAGIDLVREFEVTPNSKSVFVTKLGQDKAFIETLLRSDFLGLNLNQRQFNFDYASFDDGYEQIQACLSTFRPKVAADVKSLLGAQSQVSPKKLAAFEKEKLVANQKISQLQSYVASLEKDNQRLNTTLEKITLDLDNRGREDTQTLAQVERLNAQAVLLRKENERLQDEILKLSQQPKVVETKTVVDQKLVRNLEDKTFALELAEKRIQKLLQDKNTLNSSVQQLTQQLSVAQQKSSERLDVAQIREVGTPKEIEDPISRSRPIQSPDISNAQNSVPLRVATPEGVKPFQTAREQLRGQGATGTPSNLVANRETLARSRYTTARQRRLADKVIELEAAPTSINSNTVRTNRVPLPDLPGLNTPLATKEEGSDFGQIASIPVNAISSRTVRSQPVFDGPGEQSIALRYINSNNQAISDISSRQAVVSDNFVRSGRLKADEVASLSRPARDIIRSPKQSSDELPTFYAPQASPKASHNPQSKIEDILRKSGISLSSDLALLDDISNDTFKAYQWNSGNTFGSAEVTKIKTGEAFDVLSQAYLERTKRRCNGEFASIPTTGFQENERLAGYDIACVSGINQGAIASLLFYAHDDDFITLAFETTASNIESAMRTRDSLAQSLAN